MRDPAETGDPRMSGRATIPLASMVTADEIRAIGIFSRLDEGACERVIVTRGDPAQQIARLQARDGLSEADARARLAAQWPVDEKAARAHYVIDTNGPVADTDRQVDSVLARLKNELEEARPPKE